MDIKEVMFHCMDWIQIVGVSSGMLLWTW
jgi:hypothetical protein